MRNFLIAEESRARGMGDDYPIPARLMEAYFVTKGISWIDYRTMPSTLRDQILMVWKLTSIASEAQAKKNSKRKG